MNGRQKFFSVCHCRSSLVIIDDFNFERVSPAPTETNSPLIVKANAGLAAPLSLERLEPISGAEKKGRAISLLCPTA
jgi:hypothetical protein